MKHDSNVASYVLPRHERTDCTPSQKLIQNYLVRHLGADTVRILHVGVGNSELAKMFPNAHVDGIAFFDGEKLAADSLKLPRYRVFELNKYSPSLLEKLCVKYNYIVDNGLNSYAPSFEDYMALMQRYRQLLAVDGALLAESHSLLYAPVGAPPLPWPIFKFTLVGWKAVREGARDSVYSRGRRTESELAKRVEAENSSQFFS